MGRTSSRGSKWNAYRTLVAHGVVGIVATALVACGSSSGSTSTTSSGANSSSASSSDAQSCGGGCGTGVVSLTDAAGDFDSYIVNVVSIQLTRSDGTVVETVPTATQVDFSQLVNLSEIISAAQIPVGRYESASITLDYSGASIVVDNGTTGVPISAANIINGQTSMPLVSPNTTQMTLSLSFGTSNELVISANAIANLALDFNLAASNAITPSDTSPTTVTVNPVLTASLVPDATKQLRVRGALVSVSTADSTYVVGVRPFFNATGTSGQITVVTTGSTTFSVNGATSTGAAGLTQLAALTAGTVTAALGTWDSTAKTFTASSVLAGSSVTGATLDSVEGTVIARSGDTLTVADGVLCHAGRSGASFDRQVTVSIAAATAVTEQGVTGPFSIQDISVGQHAQFFGALSTDSTGNVSLDASSGSAMLTLTSVLGTVTGTASNTVTLTVQSLDGRAASAFNFAGTGTSSSADATASAYSVTLPAALGAASLSSGLPARFTGFVTPFGAAPPDFAATTLVNYAQTRAQLLARWASPGVVAPFATLTSAQLLISQATLKASAQDVIRIAAVSVDPSALTTGLQIDPDTTTTNAQFALGHRKSHQIDTFSTFSDFVTALTTELNGTNAALEVLADGPYNATTGVLSADQMIVVVND